MSKLLALLNKWRDHVVLENFIPEPGVVKWRCKIGDVEAEDYNALMAVRKCDELTRDVSELYHELLSAVAQKFPSESRHETALRYIREREQNISQKCEKGCSHSKK